MKIWIGTSGFNYPAWKNKFYPEQLPASRWLEHYSTQFNTLELNNTFYRFPKQETLARFYDRTPAGFIFCVKAHKIITHTLRLKGAKSKVDEFVGVAENALREKLACILFQLPGSFKYSEENLNRVLDSIAPASRHVVEFRDPSWWNERVMDALRAHNLTFCNVSYPGLPEEINVTTERSYLRMHGVPKLFESAYSQAELLAFADMLDTQVNEQFIFFNNTMFEAGYSNAYSMKEIIGAMTVAESEK